jgi:hypothetical protein
MHTKRAIQQLVDGFSAELCMKLTGCYAVQPLVAFGLPVAWQVSQEDAVAFLGFGRELVC